MSPDEHTKNREFGSLDMYTVIGGAGIAAGVLLRKKLSLKVVVLACATAAVVAATANAITFGEPDGTRHPNVGALVTEATSRRDAARMGQCAGMSPEQGPTISPWSMWSMRRLMKSSRLCRGSYRNCPDRARRFDAATLRR
jgi:hypothetical protein